MEMPAKLRVKGVEEPHWMRKPMFRIFYQIDLKNDGTSSENTADTASTNCEPLFAAAGSVANVGSLVCDEIVKKLSRTLGTFKETLTQLAQCITMA